jgi:hypothetical protein|tara:strand:- start:276 stop:1787 length:1512 start_codon:yes stop_codon:yes gene_type:complete
MAFIVADRVKETTATSGTGPYALSGAATGFQAFSDVASNNDVVYYAATDATNWEVGVGTYSSNSLIRTTILSSSNSDAAVSWTSAIKDIFLTYPAEKAVIEDSSNNVSVGNNLVVGGTVDGVDIAARDAVLTTTTTTANAALPKAGGTMTGNLVLNADPSAGLQASTKQYVDNTALLKAGGTMTGNLVLDADPSAALQASTKQYVDNTALLKAGGTMTGDLVLDANPTANLQAATKQYVDTIAAAGIHYHTPVRVESPANVPSTYANGSSGVGATLTNSGTQAAIVIDGIVLSSADRVLIYQQTNSAHNGVYTVTTVGSGSTNWVLTRATDADSYAPSDPDSLGQGDAFFVSAGDTGAGGTYVMTTVGTITFGTTGIVFSQISSTAIYSAGTGMTLTGQEFSIGQAVATSNSPTFANLTVPGNVDGRDVSVDGAKLDGIEAAADVTDATNVAAAGAAMKSNNLSDLPNASTARTNLGLGTAAVSNATDFATQAQALALSIALG